MVVKEIVPEVSRSYTKGTLATSSMSIARASRLNVVIRTFYFVTSKIN